MPSISGIDAMCHLQTGAVAAILLVEDPFKQETVALGCSALRQRTCHSTIWRTAEENADVEGFQGIQADRFAGEQFIRVSGIIPRRPAQTMDQASRRSRWAQKLRRQLRTCRARWPIFGPALPHETG